MRFTRLAAATMVGVASLLMSGVGYAEEAKPDATTTAAESSDEDTVVCRRISEVGSNMRKTKVCMTRGEWAKLNDDSKNFEKQSDDAETFTPNGQLIGPVGNTN